MPVKTALPAFAALLFLTTAVLSQNLVVNVNLRMLDFAVEDENGRPVFSLMPEDLEVVQSGQSLPVTHLSLEWEPAALGLIVDRSISMGPAQKTLDEAVSDVLSAAGAEDQAFLVTFAGESTLRTRMTNDVKLLRAGAKPQLAFGTRFYDALIDSLDYLSTVPSTGRKALIVVSDGADHYSRHSFDDALAVALTYNYPIFVIGFVGDDSLTDTTKGREEIRDRFDLLATMTGGKVFFPANWTECPRLAQQIFDNLHYRYRLGFYNPESFGPLEGVQIRLREPGTKRIIMQTARPATTLTF